MVNKGTKWHHLIQVTLGGIHMTEYEKQLQRAADQGVAVYEFDLGNDDSNSNERLDGLYLDGNVAISDDLKTDAEKSCILAEELGHHYTTHGNILDQDDIMNRKQEYHARLWGYNDRIGLTGIIYAYELGCRNLYEAADKLEVTETFLQSAIECYRRKYGVYTVLDDYVIYFEPNLRIGRIWE